MVTQSKISNGVNKIFIWFISFYQIFFSGIFGNSIAGCRFRPTCSEYGKEAFSKHSFFKALRLTLWRILRCNPFNKGGYDPIDN